MNILTISAIIAGLLLIGGVAVMALSSNSTSAAPVTKSCGSSSCNGSCTALTNCGSLSCGATTGKTCTCGKNLAGK